MKLLSMKHNIIHIVIFIFWHNILLFCSSATIFHPVSIYQRKENFEQLLWSQWVYRLSVNFSDRYLSLFLNLFRFRFPSLFSTRCLVLFFFLFARLILTKQQQNGPDEKEKTKKDQWLRNGVVTDVSYFNPSTENKEMYTVPFLLLLYNFFLLIRSQNPFSSFLCYCVVIQQ